MIKLELTIDKNLIIESKQSMDNWISLVMMTSDIDCQVDSIKNYLGHQHLDMSERGL